jgi:predicted nucleic acid-binding protein
MIILDTNVISEIMKADASPAVQAWLQEQPNYHIAITTLSIFELIKGIERLPVSAKRRSLGDSFEKMIEMAFDDRVFTLDEDAAHYAGQFYCIREKKGLHAHSIDMMIAGIAKSRRATLATRNVKDFAHCGITLINPWNAHA